MTTFNQQKLKQHTTHKATQLNSHFIGLRGTWKYLIILISDWKCLIIEISDHKIDLRISTCN